MNARGLLISLYSAPKTNISISPRTTFHCKSPLVLQLCPCQRVHLRPSYARNGFIWRIKSGVRPDVKSEPYDIAESPPDSVQFGKVLRTDDDGGGGNAITVPWWEQFPRRWVIVLLCFSAFLLCNMDRVSNASILIFFLI